MSLLGAGAAGDIGYGIDGDFVRYESLPPLYLNKTHFSGFNDGLDNGGGGALGIDIEESNNLWSFIDGGIIATANLAPDLHGYLVADQLPLAYQNALKAGCTVRVTMEAISGGAASSICPGVMVIDEDGDPSAGPILGMSFHQTSTTNTRFTANRRSTTSQFTDVAVASVGYANLMVITTKDRAPVGVVEVRNGGGTYQGFAVQNGNLNDPGDPKLAISCGLSDNTQTGVTQQCKFKLQVQPPFEV